MNQLPKLLPLTLPMRQTLKKIKRVTAFRAIYGIFVVKPRAEVDYQQYTIAYGKGQFSSDYSVYIAEVRRTLDRSWKNNEFDQKAFDFIIKHLFESIKNGKPSNQERVSKLLTMVGKLKLLKKGEKSPRKDGILLVCLAFSPEGELLFDLHEVTNPSGKDPANTWLQAIKNMVLLTQYYGHKH